MAYRYCLWVCIFVSTSLFAQQSYNSCNQALELCPGQAFSLTNIGANTTVCPTCEDNFNFCFPPNNSIWMTFQSNAVGGDVSIDFSDLNFETGVGQGNSLQAALMQAGVPCSPSSYTNIGNCESDQSTNFSITSGFILPNTTYYVVVSGSMGASTAAECTFDVEISGTGVDRPTPIMALNFPLAVCSNEIYQAYVTFQNCPNLSAITWSINGNPVAISTDTVFQTANLQNNDVLTAECSCYQPCPVPMLGGSTPITVYHLNVDAGADQSISSGDTIQLNGISSGIDITWTPSFSLSNDSILAPFAFPSESTLYTLSVADGNGCVFTDEVLLSVENALKIPNTFSPNNDGRNDTWVIVGIENYPDCSIFITDRWGQEVFQTSGYSKETAWKGESRSGKGLTEGVYFYLINLNDEDDQQFKGSITLIR